ncbi:MAG: hypothetical protein ACE5L6_02155 [Candidatus Bathyarchaeia archaeon]
MQVQQQVQPAQVYIIQQPDGTRLVVVAGLIIIGVIGIVAIAAFFSNRH